MRRKKISLSGALKHFYMIVTIMIMLFPMYLALVGSVKDLDQMLNDFFLLTVPFHFENYVKAFGYISPYFLNTVWYALVSTILTVGAATLGGYAFARLRFPCRKLFYGIMFAKMFLPGVMSLVPSFMLANKLGLLNSMWAIALFCMGTSMPFWVFVMRTFVNSQPKELFESMRIDGAREFTIFSRLTLPLLKPMVSLMTMNVILFIWNDFIWPVVTLTDPEKRTITVGIYKLREVAGMDYGMMIAGYVLAMLPLLIGFLFSMKSFMNGLTAGAIKL